MLRGAVFRILLLRRLREPPGLPGGLPIRLLHRLGADGVMSPVVRPPGSALAGRSVARRATSLYDRTRRALLPRHTGRKTKCTHAGVIDRPLLFKKNCNFWALIKMSPLSTRNRPTGCSAEFCRDHATTREVK